MSIKDLLKFYNYYFPENSKEIIAFAKAEYKDDFDKKITTYTLIKDILENHKPKELSFNLEDLNKTSPFTWLFYFSVYTIKYKLERGRWIMPYWEFRRMIKDTYMSTLLFKNLPDSFMDVSKSNNNLRTYIIYNLFEDIMNFVKNNNINTSKFISNIIIQSHNYGLINNLFNRYGAIDSRFRKRIIDNNDIIKATLHNDQLRLFKEYSLD